MNKFSLFIAFFVLGHACLAQNGYNYQRPEGPSTIAPALRPGAPGSFGTSPAFPSPSSAFPTGTAATTPAYGSTGYPSAGRPTGGAQFPIGPSTGGGPGGFPGSVDGGVTPSGPGFGSTPAGGAPGFGTSPAGRPGFGGRPGTGPAGPTGPSTGFPSGAGATGPARPGFPGTGPSTPTGPSGAGGFPGSRPGASFPGTGSGSIGGTGGGQYSGSQDDGSYDGDYSAIPGEPGQDYPIYSEIPQTSFDCNQQQWPGYYADVEAQCQVFHICALNRTYDFLCPNGTIFSQEHLVCVWWNTFDCQSAPSLYGNNAYIYDYSQTGQHSNDFAGQTQTTVGIPAGPGAQGQTGGFPGSAQRPTSSGSSGFPSSGRPTGPSASFPGATGPSANYPGATGPQGPSANYPGATGPQGPSANYPGATGPQGPSANYPGATGPQGPSTVYPGATGAGQTIGFPGSTPAPGFPGSQTPSAGTPSGFPSTGRPGFPSQGDSQFPSVTPQTPTREYLPPRRS